MTRKTKTAPKTTTTAAPAKADKAPSGGDTRTINVPKPDLTFKGQRGEWFALVAKHNGKSVADFNAAAAGRKDPPGPWLRWFAKMGYVVVQ